MSTTFPALAEAEGKLKHRQDELGRIFKEAGDDIDLTKVTGVEGAEGDLKSKRVAEHITALNDEMAELGEEIKSLRAVQRAAESAKGNQAGVEQGQEREEERGGNVKSFGQEFVKSLAYSEKGREATIDVDIKTLMTTSAGWAPESTRSGLFVESTQRPVQVTDLIPMFDWNQAAYKYIQETTFTNNAAEVAEGGTYGESAFATTEVVTPVQKIGVWVPVTDEQLEDVDGIGTYLDNRLRFQIRQRLDGQILTGNGTTPNLRGVNNVVGIQTQAKGADPTPDAVYKAIVLVRVTGRAFPDAVVMHPLDWQDIRLLRTVDGIYIWGNPSEAGPERIWGVQVVQSDAQTQNTAVVGDFGNFSLLAVKRGIEVQVSNSHSTFFVEGKQAVRADMRAALAFTRGPAFCTITGI